MSAAVVLDTNFIIRHLVQDNERQASAAGRFFGACDRAELIAVVLAPVLAECVFVLESFYRHSRADIANALGRLLTAPGVRMEQAPVYRDALVRYRDSRMHFVDCVVAARAAGDRFAVATFDRGFRVFPELTFWQDAADQ